MSPSGFSVTSAEPFLKGARRLFRFTTGAGVEVVIEAAVAYSRPDDESGYVTGFRFVHSRLTDTVADINVLLDVLGGVQDLQDEPFAQGR